jgi:hypothetical protein
MSTLVGAGVGLIGLVLVMVLAVLIGALVLRLACKICGATVPSFLKAIGVVIVVFIATFIVNLIITVAIRMVGSAVDMNLMAVQLVAGLVSLGVGALLSAALYMPFLGTSFGKGLLIWLTQVGIALLIAIVIGIVVFAVTLLFSRLH